MKKNIPYVLLCILLILWVSSSVGQSNPANRTRIYANQYGKNENSKVINPENSIHPLASDLSKYTTISASGVWDLTKFQLKFIGLKNDIPGLIPVYVKASNEEFDPVFISKSSSDQLISGTELKAQKKGESHNNYIYKLTDSLKSYNALQINLSSGLLGSKTTNIYYAYIEPYDFPLTSSITKFNSSCGPLDILEILDHVFREELIYEVIDTYGKVINSATVINQSGKYRIRVTDPKSMESKQTDWIDFTIKSVPEIEMGSNYIEINQGTAFNLPSITCKNCTSDFSVEWSNSLNEVINRQTLGPSTPSAPVSVMGIATSGYTIYKLNVSVAGCNTYKEIIVRTIDPNQSCVVNNRIYATEAKNSISGKYENVSNAITADPKTYATMTSVLNLLGLFPAELSLKWNHPIPKGTKITLKIGTGSSILGVAQGVSVEEINTKGSKPTTHVVSGGLIELLSGTNEYYYSFIASEEIKGVTVRLGGLLSLAQSIRLFHAWYDQEGSLNCNEPDIKDVLPGSAELIKGVLNAASALVTVSNPWNIADGNDSTYANLFAAASVAAYAKLDVVFKSVSQPGDSIFIRVGNIPAAVSVLTGFTIQRYLGNTPVGDPLTMGGNLLSLLRLKNGEFLIMTVTTEPYDRIGIRLGGVVGVLESMKIYSVIRKPYIHTFSPTELKHFVICEGDRIQVGLNDKCLSYDWYSSAEGGTSLGRSIHVPTSYTNSGFMPVGLGYKTYYVQNNRLDCQFGPRMPVTVLILPKPGKPHLTLQNIIN